MNVEIGEGHNAHICKKCAALTETAEGEKTSTGHAFYDIIFLFMET